MNLPGHCIQSWPIHRIMCFFRFHMQFSVGKNVVHQLDEAESATTTTSAPITHHHHRHHKITCILLHAVRIMHTQVYGIFCKYMGSSQSFSHQFSMSYAHASTCDHFLLASMLRNFDQYTIFTLQYSGVRGWSIYMNPCSVLSHENVCKWVSEKVREWKRWRDYNLIIRSVS